MSEPTQDEESPAFQPLATWALVFANAGIFLSMTLEGAGWLLADPTKLVEFGGASAMEIWQGEVWRLLSAVFVHGAVWHILLNMLVLVQVGQVLERVLGASRFLLLYLVSGIFGFALSLLVHPGLTVGASGAIFGVVGGLFAFASRSRGRPISRLLFAALTPFVVATLVVGFLVPFIDNSAHVGGFAMGFLLGFGLLQERVDAAVVDGDLRASPGRPVALTFAFGPRVGWASLGLAGALFAILVPMALSPAYSPPYQVASAWTALGLGEVADAEALAEKAVALAPDDASVLILKGRLVAENDRAAARPYMEQALLLLDDEDPERAMAKVGGLIGARSTDDASAVYDALTTAVLCDAALERAKGKPGATLANNCAWVMVKSDDPRVKDVRQGLTLAERAVEITLSGPELDDRRRAEAAHFLHTLAEARAQNGDPEEARITMERVVVLGLSDAPFFREELERFRTEAAAARRAAGSKPSRPAPAPTDDGVLRDPTERSPEARVTDPDGGGLRDPDADLP